MFLHAPLNLSSCNDNKVFCHVIAGCADKLTLSCIRTYAYVRMYVCTYVCMHILIVIIFYFTGVWRIPCQSKKYRALVVMATVGQHIQIRLHGKFCLQANIV